MRLHGALAVAFCAAQGLAQQWMFLDGPCAAGRGVAYDSRRGRAVIFGSEGETWEFDGTTRLHRAVSAGPFGRGGHVMVYDPARGHVLLFGGRTSLSLGDTWLWDGSTWQQPFSTVSPTRRSDAGIAFDSVRNRVVMFGGQDLGTALLDDTWEHDGTQWIQRAPLTVPAPANSPRLAFDSARNVTVMVLAGGGTGGVLVFEWNGTDWSQRPSTTTAPGTAGEYAVSYDPVRQRTVLFGGSTNGNELWEWNGSAWQLMVGNAPTAPANPGMYFDPALAATVIMGGQTGGWQTASWTWNGTTFQARQPNHSPTSRYGYSLFHDTVRNKTVSFGGMRFQPNNETWEWDGLRWTERTPLTVPPARRDALACFDPVTATGLLYGGGVDHVTHHADCWRYDGTNWTQVPGPVPTTRLEGNLAWDGARNEAILFGGLRTGVFLGDTWRFNGTAWTQVATPAAPSPRSRHAMAFDPGRGRLVMFGGASNGVAPANYLNDTWEWDGTQWHRVITAQSPPALLGACMIHDPVRAKMLLVGVNFISQPLRDLQAWEYDGTNWTLLLISSANLADATQLTWDPVRQRAVLFDGTSVRELTPVPAAADALGTGCGAPPPMLAARARPRTGEHLFGLELSTRPNLPVVFALGFGLGSTPIGNGCTVLVQQIAASSFVLAAGNGTAVLPIPLPPNHALRGLLVHSQGFALDPAAPGGLALSAGLRITVGD